MLKLPPSVRVFVARGPTDLRKGFNGLTGLVIGTIEEDPQSGHLFVFLNRRRDKIKLLWWDRSGYMLLYKRLESGRFSLFDQADGKSGSFEITSSDLDLILEGIDLRGARRRRSAWEVKREAS